MFMKSFEILGVEDSNKPQSKDLHLFDSVLPRIYVSSRSNFKGSGDRGRKNPDCRHDKRSGKKDVYNRLDTWYSLGFCLAVPEIWLTCAQSSWTQGDLSPSCSYSNLASCGPAMVSKPGNHVQAEILCVSMGQGFQVGAWPFQLDQRTLGLSTPAQINLEIFIES